MRPVLTTKSAEVADLCRRHHVRRLEVFGSVTGHGFDPRASDMDFLVEFLDLTPGDHAHAYFGLMEELRQLFQTEVDLLEVKSVRNPFLMESINESRTTLYAA